MRVRVSRGALVAGWLGLAAACGSGSPTSPAVGLSASQQQSVAATLGTVTIAAIESGAFALGFASPAPTSATSHFRLQASAGSAYGTATCPAGGRADITYARDYSTTAGDLDLSAFKVVYTGCAISGDPSGLVFDGQLTMSGHYYGQVRTPDIHVAGALTTALGSCDISGAITSTGSFGGTACGAAVAATSPVTPAPYNFAGSWTAVVVTTQGTVSTSFTLQQSGTHITGGNPNVSVGGGSAAISFDLTQTAGSGTTLILAGTSTVADGGTCSPQTSTGGLTVNTATNAMSGSFTGLNTDCTHSETFSITLHK